MKNLIRTTATVIAILAFSAAHGGVIWDESLDGDLSDLSATPTSLGLLAFGDNDIINVEHTGTGVGGAGSDWFTFSVAAGTELVDLVVSNYRNTNAGAGAFIALFDGLSVGDPTADAKVAAGLMTGDGSLLGVSGFGEAAFGAVGAGDYTFWANETGGIAGWDLRLVVRDTTAVSEPAVLFLLLPALVIMMRRRLTLQRA